MSNCITDDIKHAAVVVWDWNQLFMVCFFYDFRLIFKVFIYIHEYANEVICISGHRMKGICLTFYLVPRLVVYDKHQLRYD